MKVLVVDPILFLGPTLVQRLVKDGHEVVYAPIWGPKSDSPFMDALCRGLGAKVDPEGWMNWIGWADVATITGSEHRGHITKFLRENDVPVCGPGAWATRLELDRSFGHEVFRSAGMNPSTQRVFKNAEEAAKFVAENPSPYVIKLDQTARAVAETFVGHDPDGRDIRSYLRDLGHKLRSSDGRVKVYLEDLVDGVEVGVGGFFNGKTFLGDLMVTFETDGGYAYDFNLSADKLLDRKKLEAVLAKAGYKGSFDLNGFLTEDGEWRPIEWTPRWGAGTTEFIAYAAPDLAKLLYAAATGGKAEVVRTDLRKSVVALVNARDEDTDMEAQTEITLPQSAGLPFFDESGAFFARWPARSRMGWHSLPVAGMSERRTGIFIGFGPDLESALEGASEVASKVKVNGSHAEVGRAREDITPQHNRVSEFMTGKSPENEWIGRMARDTGHMWQGG